MTTSEADIVAFLREHIASVWALEVLLHLVRDPARGWAADDLVRELRSSAPAIDGALRVLARAGLAARDPAGPWRHMPATPARAAMAQAIAALYAAKPTLVVRTILAAPEAKLRLLADAFKLKDP